jgi:hypothetical protein
MVKLSETDIREMLDRRATEFEMALVPSDAVLRKARRRKVKNAVLASAGIFAVAALVGGLSVSLLSGSERSADSPAGGSASPAATRGQLRLVDYAVRTPARDDHHTRSGSTTTLHDVRKHARCMRSKGFDVPEPTRQPGGGWSVIVDHPKANGLDFRSRRFREAWFVSCGPLGGPFSGDLVIGGPRPKVDRFTSCMGSQGYDLPAPTKDRSGRFDVDEWEFDLSRTSIDTSTRAWNRAMFVTCAPDDI